SSGICGDIEGGKPAPDFTLDFATKDTIIGDGFTLSKEIGKSVIILAFYPADWSGGCTKEMCTMRDNFGELSELNAAVYGISGDYPYSHKAWAKEHNLPFALLSDNMHNVATMYNSFHSESGYTKRTVFVIDMKGTIVYADLQYSTRDVTSFEKLQEALRTIR
ncbi:MAG: peroxiredoxin, partial [Bacteroidota bacterium]